MKNKTGIIIGFISGFAGFLLLFKFLILDKTPPEDEVAPGLVMLAAIFFFRRVSFFRDSAGL
ncbi:hypothetical protein WG906_13900 [Pedobacter sp. P351]|uniref:hypothetical protein n=1 Tax=Pedobacter superstes TaxID=3133441 RepID=UPI0030AC8206